MDKRKNEQHICIYSAAQSNSMKLIQCQHQKQCGHLRFNEQLLLTNNQQSVMEYLSCLFESVKVCTVQW